MAPKDNTETARAAALKLLQLGLPARLRLPNWPKFPVIFAIFGLGLPILIGEPQGLPR